jgi:Calx-beta domain/FG-GAP-like repeat
MKSRATAWSVPAAMLSCVVACMTTSNVAHALQPDAEWGPPKYTLRGCPSYVDLSQEVVAKATGLPVSTIQKLQAVRYHSLAEICTLSDRRMKRSLYRIDQPKPTGAGEWAKQRARQLASSDGIVKPDGMLQAMAQREMLVVPRSERVAGITASTWTELGPGNIGGRTRSISINPANTNDILLGSVSGGLWRSTNAGASWAAVNDFMPNVAISTLARVPGTPTTIYAGTGEGFFNGHAILGFGIFRSTDGGATWSHVSSTAASNAAPQWYFVNRIAVHATNPAIIVAATGEGLYRSTNTGATWTRVYSRRVLDVKFDPNTPNRVLVAEGESGYFEGASFVPDGGGVAVVADITTAVASGSNGAASTLGSFSRTKLEAGVNGRVEITYAPGTNGLAIATLQSPTAPCTAGSTGRLFRSLDGGATWALNSSPCHLGQQGWYDQTVWIDPVDSTRLVIGGIDLFRATSAGNWWTANTPLTWTKISNWQVASVAPSPHADQHVVISDPGYNGTTNRTVYVGNDGGIYRANDITIPNGDGTGTGWTKLNNGLAITQFYGGAGRTATGKLIGGTQDNGTLIAPASGTNWVEFFGGDGGFVAVDPVDPNILYGEYIFASIFRSTDGGATADFICAGITEGEQDGCGGDGSAPFISAFILDPNNSSRLLVGGLSLWRTNDSKAASVAWSAIRPPLGSNSGISAIAVAPGNSNVIWVGYESGEIGCTTNGTQASPTWVAVSGTPSRYAQRIMIDPNNNNRVFVTSGGYDSPNVHETTGGCAATPGWTSRHGNLPAAPVRSIVRHPTLANWLYVGTEVGVFASTDGGLNWSTTNDGPGNVSADELFWLDNATLAVATHGRGMFKSTIAAGSLQFTVANMTAPEAGGSATVFVSRTGGTAGSVSATYTTVAETGPGKATAGADYTAVTSTIQFADGEGGTKSFTVSILNDAQVEGNETFRIDLSSPTGGATLGAQSSITVGIVDDDVGGAGVPQDFNLDGRSDLLWRNNGDGAVQGWLMNGLSATQVAGLLPAGGYTITHVADLDGNGKADTLIRHTDGTTIGWLHDGLNVVGQATFFAPGSGWSIKHAADLNGDGKADLIVENTNGTVVGWLMNGLTVTATATFVPAGTGWSVSRVGDLNGDGKADLIWQNTNGTVQAWLMNGLSATQTATYVGAGTGWSVKLVADFNGDSKADLVWQNTDGTVQAWLMDGTAISQIASFVPAGTGWSPVLAGDISGDGKADLFWEHTDGRSQTWLMNGLSVTSLAGFVGAGGWKATHLLDLNGDGRRDVLWKHTDGTVQAWLMNGLTISQIASLAGAGSYEVIPPRP